MVETALSALSGAARLCLDDSNVARLPGVVALLAFVGCSACSTTRVVSHPVSPAMAAGIVEAIGGREVDVDFQSSGAPPFRPYQARGARLTMTDRYFLIDQGSRSQKLPSFFIPFEGAQQIRYKDASKGALEGFLMGAIPGVVLGFALGAYTNAMACSGSDQGDVAYCHNHSDPTLSAVLGLGLLTGGLGALMGALAGHRTVYSF